MSPTETTNTPGTLLSIREAADRLSVSTATVHRLIQVRDLDHLRLGRRTIRIRESALNDYLTRCTVRRLR
ncbi:helix-turn-helix domain-containing protein [Euzebya rosea]|uniref:helix-turn-helix domain-containing protein n=1 Tax=Euzebya rosea TaxID=2052804 RepID=UPI000D3E4652|nr:helix-turn-helix domain-containing protein [Euzebya rosea]